MATRTAWAVADLADGGSARWLAAADRSRLRKRLAAVDVAEVVQRWLTLRANRIVRYRAGVDDLEAVLLTEGVVRTGVSAVAAYRLGLGIAGSADAYVDGETAARLVQDFFLIESASGNLTLRVVERDYHLVSARALGDKRVAPRLIVGADLADDSDVRTRATGLKLIDGVLAEQRM